MDLQTGKIYNSVEEALEESSPNESYIDFCKRLNKPLKISFVDYMKYVNE